jgi:hypothetical protein
MISTLVVVSRLPVGSSANSTCGCATMARAIATRCCWPPDSWLGTCDFAAGESDLVQRLARACVTLFGRQWPIDQRQLDVFERSRAAEQLKPWNTKPR